MDKPLSLDVAMAQLQQAMRDFEASVAHAMGQDAVARSMSAGAMLQAARYVERNGLTDGGRKQLRTAIELARNELGVE